MFFLFTIKMSTKQDRIEGAILRVIKQCMTISNLNPRVKNKKSNLIYKSVSSFARDFNQMTPEEREEMMKSFYSQHYLDAIVEDGVSDWLDPEDSNDVVKLGLIAGDVAVTLNLTACYRIAKELDNDHSTSVSKFTPTRMSGAVDATTGPKWAKHLHYDILHLIYEMASNSVKNELSPRLASLESELSIPASKSLVSSTPSGPATAPPNPMAGLQEFLGPMMEKMGPMLQSMFQPSSDGSTSSAPANPFASLFGNGQLNMTDMMSKATENLSNGTKSELEQVMGDLQSGTINFEHMMKVSNNVISEFTQPKTSIPLLSDDDEIPASLPATLLPQHPVDLMDCECDGEVCYMKN